MHAPLLSVGETKDCVARDYAQGAEDQQVEL